MQALLQRSLVWVIFLYFLSTTVSVAGMEATSWTAFLLSVALAINLWVQKRQKYFVALGNDWAYWGFWLVVAVGAFLHPYIPTERTTYILGEPRWILLFYVLVAFFCHNDTIPQRWIVFTMGLLTVFNFYAVFQSYTGYDLTRSEIYTAETYGGIGLWRGRGPFSNTMTYSYSYGQWYAMIFASLLVGWAKPQWVRILFIMGLTAASLAMLFTFTRGLWIALFVSVLCMLILANRRRYLLYLAILVVLVGVTQAANPVLNDRLKSFIDTKNTSNSQRLQIWRSNLEMVKDHPLFGIGWRENEYILPEYYKKLGIESKFVGHSHSNFLQVLSNTGFLGFICYLVLMLTIFITTLKAWWRAPAKQLEHRFLLLWAIGAQICFHIGGLTESTFIDGEVLHTFMLSVAPGLAVALKHYRRH